jgi:hypothetical protein
MGPLIMVSRLPLYMAVTVALKGAPATTVEGAVISRIAWDEPQLSETSPRIATLEADNNRGTSSNLKDLNENAVSRRKPGLDTLSSLDTVAVTDIAVR